MRQQEKVLRGTMLQTCLPTNNVSLSFSMKQPMNLQGLDWLTPVHFGQPAKSLRGERTLTYFLKGGTTEWPASCSTFWTKFLGLGRCVKLITDIFVWSNPFSQTGGQLYSDTFRYRVIEYSILGVTNNILPKRYVHVSIAYGTDVL